MRQKDVVVKPKAETEVSDPQDRYAKSEGTKPSSVGASPVLMMEEAASAGESQKATPLLVDYSPATTLDEVKSKTQQLPQLSRSLIATDVTQVLGSTPQAMADRYLIDSKGKPDLEARMTQTHSFAFRVLDDLATKVLSFTKDNEFQNLNPERMSIDRYNDATSQHVGYVAGVLSRSDEFQARPGRELSRILVRSSFEGKLRDTSGEGPKDPRALLARELSKAAGGSPEIENFVNDPNKDYLFSPEELAKPGSLLPNLASYHAGEATMQFASKLMGGNDRKAEAFVKHVFGRPAEELNQMLLDPQGSEGILVNFAATAHHQAWQWAKLGAAGVAAKAGDEVNALKKWNHSDIGPTRKVVVEDADAANKISDQVESYLLREGRLVPCERGGEHGATPLAGLLKHVERHGIYNDNADNLRIISRPAKEVKHRLWSEVDKASRLSDWRAGNELAGNVVAHTCASFAGQAVNANFEERDGLVTLYRDAISRFSPQLDKLLANGAPKKGDDAYQAFFQELAGEFGFEALKEHMGVGKAHDLVRKASIAHLIPIACDCLRLPVQEDFTAQNITKDIAELKEGLFKGDYFLSKEGFVEGLQEEAAQPVAEVDRKDLENGIRVPNAIWMWTQLTRGLVENKPNRYTGGEADMSSDKFPSSVQFNPPDIRDVELFVWARHRLSEAGHPPKKANRMALATVVLTLYKDLLQLRKAS